MKIRFFALLSLILGFVSISQAREMGEPDLSGDDFIKRFTANYGVLSEKEPPLSDLEIAVLKKLAPMMRVNKDYAQSLLKSMTVAEDESSATFNYLLGNVYFENNEYLLAEEEYKAAIESFPDFQRAWTNLGVLKLRSGDTRNALKAFLRAVELGDNDAHTFGMLGFCHYSEGNYISAEVAYDRAMLAQPDNRDWLEGKAQVYFKAERLVEAVRMQDELISREPYNIDYWLAQANTYLAMEDYSRTARNLEIVNFIGAADFHALNLLGNLYTKMKMPGPASDAYLAAANYADPSNIEFLVNSANILFKGKQYAAARALFEKANPSAASVSPEILYKYRILAGDFAQRDGLIDEAISFFEEAETLDPLDGAVLVRLAKLHDQKGNRDKAYFLLDRAEGDPEAEFEALLTRVKFLVEEERFEESQVFVGRALKLQSTESIQNLYAQVEQAAQATK
ncbi:MAG: tetratricopeptide repeat protein [Verrucomicrobiota bacterium]